MAQRSVVREISRSIFEVLIPAWKKMFWACIETIRIAYEIWKTTLFAVYTMFRVIYQTILSLVNVTRHGMAPAQQKMSSSLMITFVSFRDNIPGLIAVPAVLVMGHYFIYWLVRRLSRQSLSMDKGMWATISFVNSCVWMWVFWPVLPFGTIHSTLLLESVWNSRGLEVLCGMYLLSFVMFFVYYLVTYATASTASPGFLTRKAIPVFAILYSLWIVGAAPPSHILRLVAWLLRYMVVDAVFDAVYFVGEIARKSRVRPFWYITASALVTGMWMFLIMEIYSYELHRTIMATGYIHTIVTGWMALSVFSLVQ